MWRKGFSFMSEIVRSLSNAQPAKDVHGVRPGYAELESPQAPKLQGLLERAGLGAPAPDVSGRVPGATSEWSVSPFSATIRCTCGFVGTYSIGHDGDLLFYSPCCKYAAKFPNKRRVERAVVAHQGLEVRS